MSKVPTKRSAPAENLDAIRTELRELTVAVLKIRDRIEQMSVEIAAALFVERSEDVSSSDGVPTEEDKRLPVVDRQTERIALRRASWAAAVAFIAAMAVLAAAQRQADVQPLSPDKVFSQRLEQTQDPISRFARPVFTPAGRP